MAAVPALRLFVDSPAFMAQFERDLASAARSVCVQTMSFEGDEAGRRLAQLLAGRPDLERTLIVDRYCLYCISDRFLPWPPNAFSPALWRELAGTLSVAKDLKSRGVTVHWTNPVGFMLRRFVGRNHKKLVLIDDRIAYFGGINVCDHNFAWHDAMLRVEDDEAGAFLREDVRATLRGENLPWRGRFGDVEIVLLDGVQNEQLSEPVFTLIREARRSVYVQSAYLSFPFYDELAAAVRRGVSVTVIAPEFNNKPKLDRYVQWITGRLGITLRLYRGRMTHLKAMLIDDETLIVGSSNFDFLSHRVQQEVIAIVRNPSLIADYRRDVLEPDLARSVAPSRTIDPRWEWWKHQGILGGAWLTVRLSRLGRVRPSDGRAGPVPQPAVDDPE